MGEYAAMTKQERALRHMTSPYQEGTRLDRVFLFMQNGSWHHLYAITDFAYSAPSETGMRGLNGSCITSFRKRTASTIRTIRSHPDLRIEFNGELYRMTLQ